MISFHNQDISFNLKNKKKLKQWIVSTIQSKKRIAGDINFIFCSDESLLEINLQYLKHNTYTDIITFDYSKGDAQLPIAGDIFISIDRVKENAITYSKTFQEELNRVMIHGVLHLLGYKDKTKDAKAEMTKEENVCLKKLSMI